MDKKVLAPLALLTGMREVLAKPEAWTKEFLARNEKNVSTDVLDSTACKFCLIGAASKVTGFNILDAGTSRPYSILQEELRHYVNAGEFSYVSISIWNDASERTHGDVLKFLDTRIAHHLGVKAPN